MKRKIALLLTIAFIFSLALPISGFAAMDKELENAIKIAKTTFDIPDTYTFQSNIGTNGTKKIYSLNWNSKDKTNPAGIYVTIDEGGIVLNYSKYSQDDYKQVNKLPKLSRQDALAKANQYIESIAPGLSKELKYQENTQNSIMDSGYYMNYYRVVNGIPFYNDSVSVNINRDTGALQNYSRQWTDIASFPAASSAISIGDAQKAFAEKLGLRLIYKYGQKDGVPYAYLAYVPVYDNNSYALDAFTGEKRRISGGLYVTFGQSTNALKAMAASDAGGVQLSPEELNAVEEAGKLLSQEEAEKIARSSEFLNLSDSFKLQSYYLNSVWPDKNQYAWSLYFTKPADDKTNYTDYVNVTINARTGVITGFNRGNPVNATAKPINDITKAKAQVDAFLNKYYPQFVKQIEYDKLTSESYLSDTDQNMAYSFVYYRMVNGIPFPDNGITVNYDNTNGTINGFNMNWFDMSFPDSKVIGLDAASSSMFEKVGLELQYKVDNTEVNANAKILPQPSPDNTRVVLVYALKNNKPLIISAINGAVLSADGTEYKEPVKVSYTDIKGNAAEKQIMVLADNGIYLEGSQFKPGAAITQLDFLTLLSKTLSYYGPVITPKSASQDIDELYAYLQREGIVKAGERAPAANVTREEAVKYLVRALKFDKVADIKGIFNISYKDKASISPSLTGYVAIAAGLGIVGGTGSFNPKARITRGESAVMIYNYLQS